MPQPLESLKISGFRSIDSLTLSLSSEVTLLVGSNGAGKSNIVDALELIGYAIDGKLQDQVLDAGGFDRMLHRGQAGLDATSIGFEVWGAWADARRGQLRNGYRMRLSAGAEDEAILTETSLLHGSSYANHQATVLGRGRESGLRAASDKNPSLRHLADVLAGCRVFHFDDTSRNAPPLTRADVADAETLHGDARNLAAVLLEMQESDRARYDALVRSVRAVAPFFDDFVLRPRGDSVLLRWRERGIDDVFSGAQLSSGTLRFICLATLLQQPAPPATIVLDEPELGLHPAAIHQLAALLQSAGRGRRVLAATQSVSLLSQFSIEEVAVVERVQGGTTVARPDVERLDAWLDDYSLGQLWEMNLLGGRPRPSDAPVRSDGAGRTGASSA